MISTDFLPQPDVMSFTDWTAQLCDFWAELGVPTPPDEAEWVDWACSLLVFPELAALPSPIGFSDWRDWANRVVETTLR